MTAAGSGVIAVSCVKRLTFDERIDHRTDNTTKSMILIWSFSDPIHPQVEPTHERQTVITVP
jgi:hypothetical protein